MPHFISLSIVPYPISSSTIPRFISVSRPVNASIFSRKFAIFFQTVVTWRVVGRKYTIIFHAVLICNGINVFTVFRGTQVGDRIERPVTRRWTGCLAKYRLLWLQSSQLFSLYAWHELCNNVCVTCFRLFAPSGKFARDALAENITWFLGACARVHFHFLHCFKSREGTVGKRRDCTRNASRVDAESCAFDAELGQTARKTMLLGMCIVGVYLIGRYSGGN